MQLGFHPWASYSTSLGLSSRYKMAIKVPHKKDVIKLKGIGGTQKVRQKIKGILG